MTLLKFKQKYVITSAVAVNTNLAALQDDTEAIKNFNLGGNQVVLAIYQENNIHGATQHPTGKQTAISIDGTDRAHTWDSPDNSDYCCRTMSFWIGVLAAGAHTIKGRFCSSGAGNTVTINNRVLLIYILDGDEYQYVDDATLAITQTGTAFVDDPNASVTFTPTAQCKALILYNAGKAFGATEHNRGKKVAIRVTATDYAQGEKSPNNDNSADSICTCHVQSLAAAVVTVKGRYCCVYPIDATVTVSINRRQLGVLMFDDATLFDYVTSNVQVSTNNNFPVDDAQATINRNLAETRELLVIAMGTKRRDTASSLTGEAYGISVDAADKTNSRGSPGGLNNVNADSASTCWADTLAAGNHAVQGRYGNNNGADNARIDSRRVTALWLEGSTTTPPAYTSPASKLVEVRAI